MCRTILRYAILLFLCSHSLLAADSVVRGTVSDAAGRSVAGAVVTIVGSSERVVTGAGGQYAITLPSPNVEKLRFSASGFLSEVMATGARDFFDVTLYPAAGPSEIACAAGGKIVTLRATTLESSRTAISPLDCSTLTIRVTAQSGPSLPAGAVTCVSGIEVPFLLAGADADRVVASQTSCRAVPSLPFFGAAPTPTFMTVGEAHVPALFMRLAPGRYAWMEGFLAPSLGFLQITARGYQFDVK